jgi:hypothetical protein
MILSTKTFPILEYNPRPRHRRNPPVFLSSRHSTSLYRRPGECAGRPACFCPGTPASACPSPVQRAGHVLAGEHR